MITIMNDLPDNVLGICADGKISGADYDKVLIPAMEYQLKTNDKLRVLYQLGNSFEGFEIDTVKDDKKKGIKHLSVNEKNAIVSDHQFINSYTNFLSHLITCDMRVFKNDEMAQAKKWIITDDDDSSERNLWVQNSVDKIDTEFPLSGGETNADLEQVLGLKALGLSKICGSCNLLV